MKQITPKITSCSAFFSSFFCSVFQIPVTFFSCDFEIFSNFCTKNDAQEFNSSECSETLHTFKIYSFLMILKDSKEFMTMFLAPEEFSFQRITYKTFLNINFAEM